jgi:hypothetical protein
MPKKSSTKLKFKPVVSCVELNPEQAVLSCNCYNTGVKWIWIYTGEIWNYETSVVYDGVPANGPDFTIHGCSSWNPKTPIYGCPNNGSPSGQVYGGNADKVSSQTSS